MSGSTITKLALSTALKQLMVKDDFSKISIGEICEACSMNRKSFYYHFRDKYELVNWIFQTGFIESVSLRDYENGWEFLTDVIGYMYSERIFYKHALSIDGQNAFKDYFAETLTPFIDVFFGDAFKNTNNPAYYIKLISKTIVSLIIIWLGERNPIPPEEFTENLSVILENLQINYNDSLL